MLTNVFNDLSASLANAKPSAEIPANLSRMNFALVSQLKSAIIPTIASITPSVVMLATSPAETLAKTPARTPTKSSSKILQQRLHIQFRQQAER